MKIRKVVLLIVLVTICLVVASIVIRPSQTVQADYTVKLSAPQFVTQAQPNSTDSFIGDKLDAEAGISAYYKTTDAITLSQVRGVFRTIETETSEYIIGSVAVPNYSENYDAHVYVNKNGWILAYYLREDNVSKIVDVYNKTISTTNFTTVIGTVSAAAGAPFFEETYYDFRYPSATNMLFVAEDSDNGNSFTIKAPPTYGIFERGWALKGATLSDYFNLDGANLTPTYYFGALAYGSITAGQFPLDVTHTITIHSYSIGAYGVLTLIYRVP